MITDFSIGMNLYAYIRHNLKRGSTILELGSGEVSGLLSLDYTVYSVEHNPDYIMYHTNYIHAPIVNGWYDLRPEDLPKNYDLLLIDGPPESIGRGGILKYMDLFDLSVPVIVDDTHREIEMKIAKTISKTKGVGIIGRMDGKKEFCVI